MKKLFTLFTLVLMAVSCFATDYTDELVIDGKSQDKRLSPLTSKQMANIRLN